MTRKSINNTGGFKYDQDKPPMDLIPSEALFEVAEILKFGAEKYEPYNWARGMAYSRLTAAALRHIFKFNSGEDKDPETDKSHISHAICCLLFLAEYEKRKEHYWSFDDRFDWETKKNKNA